MASVSVNADINEIYGWVRDQLTKEPLIGTQVSLYSDTTLVTKYTVTNDMTFAGSRAPYLLEVPKEGGSYKMKFVKEGYEDLTEDITIKPFKKGESFKYLKDFVMKRKPKEYKVGEAVVTATKVKIYHKGDTLVYNADAFQLAEGSMLDGLIKSLPNAELKDNGEIFVNSRKVDALLLNGEYFFKGKNKVLLENLPSYMVKDLKVYDRKKEYDIMSGLGSNQREYVMDVNLKKQYAIGWIGNVEAGAGTHDRYLARLFALRFTDASRLTLYGNMNNLNDSRKPGEDSQWMPDKMPAGLVSQKTGGLDYLIRPKGSQHRFQGNAELLYADADRYVETTNETFLPSGNTFGKSMTKRLYDNFEVSTNHNISLQSKSMKKSLYISPYASYSSYNNRDNVLSATFDRNPFLYFNSEHILDSLRSFNCPLLKSITLNRFLSESKMDGKQITAGTSLSGRIKALNHVLSLGSSISYTGKENNDFSQIRTDYPNRQDIGTDFRNRYTNDHPNRNTSYSVGATYNYHINSRSQIRVNYRFGQDIKTRDYENHRLDALEDWSLNTIHALGTLPSEMDFRFQTMDLQNSYNLHEIHTLNNIETGFYTNYFPEKNNDKAVWYEFSVNLAYNLNHYRLNYTKSNYSGITSRNANFFNPGINGSYRWKDNQREIRYNYEWTHQAPEMTSLIEIENTEDPLNIYNGNRNLKNSSTHEMKISYTGSNFKKGRGFTIAPSYTVYTNSIAYGYVYDKTTGIRRYSPDNVNGNYKLSLEVKHHRPLDKKGKLTLKTNTYGHLIQGVDLITAENNAISVPVRSSVRTLWGTESLNIEYELGKHTIGLKGYYGIGHTTSSREDFNNLTLHDFNYGVTALLQLPLDFQLSTDLTMYSRRGYASSEANTNDLVWNARISKRVPKANLTFMLDGFDILNNLSNITQTLNSQGRTETFRNALPRYLMAHVIYRLNVKPKNR